jgi:hypothetical protein
MRRRPSAAAGLDGDAVVETILNDFLARGRLLKRSTLNHRALMRGAQPVA